MTKIKSFKNDSFARKIYRKYYVNIYPLIFKANKRVMCPFCHWEGKEFLPTGINPRKNAICPKCGSLERHRLYYLYLKKIIPKNKHFCLLHIAPEKTLCDFLKSYNNIKYLSIDLDPHKAMKKADIQNMSFHNNSFDIIFCSHVLEHVDDDRKAMKEFLRVLKPNGFAILQVPISKNEKTFEDRKINNQNGKEIVYGQCDHVRIYGKDYKQKLESCGFNVKLDNYFNTLDQNTLNKYALRKETIYFCTK